METQVTRAWVMNKLAEQMNTAHLFNKEHRDLQEDRLAQLDQRLAEATLTFTERLEAGIRQELAQQLAVNESARQDLAKQAVEYVQQSLQQFKTQMDQQVQQLTAQVADNNPALGLTIGRLVNEALGTNAKFGQVENALVEIRGPPISLRTKSGEHFDRS